MTVRTAALPRQRVDGPAARTQRRRLGRRLGVAFVAALVLAELAWIVVLFELARRIV